MLGVCQVAGGLGRRKRADIVEHYLQLVGLEDATHKKPSELSTGMKQRVGLARPFALSPKLLPSRRAVRGARLAHPLRAAGRAAGAVRAGPEDGVHGHPRRGRGALPVRPGGHDDQRFPARAWVASSRCRFPRPRVRAAVLEHPQYYELREELLAFLNGPGAHGASAQATVVKNGQRPDTLAVPEQRPDIAGALGALGS